MDSDSQNLEATRMIQYKFPTSAMTGAISTLGLLAMFSEVEKIRIMSIIGIVIIAGVGTVCYTIGSIVYASRYYKSTTRHGQQTH